MTHQCAKILDSLERMTTFGDMLDSNMGADLCKIATDGVQATLASQADPGGQGWPELSAKYAEWKARNYGTPMGVLHGLMTDPQEVAGNVVSQQHDSVAVGYGVTPEAQAEADWFQQGGGNRPPRPFWGLTNDSLAAIRDYLANRLKEKVG